MTICVKVNRLDPFMDAKLNSKILLLKPFFVFVEPFRARLASKFAKRAYMTQNYFHNISILA